MQASVGPILLDVTAANSQSITARWERSDDGISWAAWMDITLHRGE
jgi:hypothetical protein